MQPEASEQLHYTLNEGCPSEIACAAPEAEWVLVKRNSAMLGEIKSTVAKPTRLLSTVFRTTRDRTKSSFA